MAYREIEFDFGGFGFYEIEAQITVRDGEVQRIEIESARRIPEQGEPSEVELTPSVRGLLTAEVERYVDDPESRRELENEDIEAARDDAEQAKIDQWKEERRR